MSLGNSFPPDFRRRQIEQCLVPGAVLDLEIAFPEVTKNKYLVLVASPDEDYLHFIINSETNKYLQSRAHLNVCQVSIDAATHRFLSHDSTIACHEVLAISKEDIIAALMTDFGCYKGKVSPAVKNEIVAAVKHAVTLSKVQQREIIAALDAEYAGY